MSEVTELQADTWDDEVAKAEGPVVVDFWHQMCGWCLKLAPEYEKLPQHFEDVKFGKMNVLDSVENRRIAMDHGVMGTPTIKARVNLTERDRNCTKYDICAF
jgi:thioredoxin 1